MKKLLTLGLGLLLSTQLFAADFDLKATMKQMKQAFKQAAQAETIEDMQQPIIDLNELVEQAKLGDYPPEKKNIYLEGFNKLTVTLEKIESELQAGKLEEAKASLKNIDSLREEYHDKRNPSIWDRIFG
ncbi:cytochrome b562 [Vibrio ziniensis]|uniref:Cytochrome b562 family protein n=1 Tax=Vibrio ziniensis TaxID=2711221 RepID=A0A6G7CPQ8_9VIBR|nr:cytochrome b562 [Vibrio ziniensis]QIH44064.1 cytochrome b562 family protein [Vibrio ziniensis]